MLLKKLSCVVFFRNNLEIIFSEESLHLEIIISEIIFLFAIPAGDTKSIFFHYIFYLLIIFHQKLANPENIRMRF